MSSTSGTALLGLRIDALPIPETLDASDPAAADFLAAAAVVTEADRHDSGTDLFDIDPAEWLVGMRSTQYYERIVRIARHDGDIVGVLGITYDRGTERTVELGLSVRPASRGRGIEDALLAEAERMARDHGRSVIHTWNFVRADAPGERLASPAGHGSIPRDVDSTRLLQQHGYTLGQVERISVFDLRSPTRETEQILEAALAKAGPDYRVVWWQDHAPDEYIDGYAAALMRMATDVPSGELEWEQDRWDAERIRYRERLKREAGQVMAVTIVVHEPTGAVAAFNELVSGRDRARPTFNNGTLVVPEHRGHRLGAIVKCAGLLRWREAVPQSPCVATFNAEENRFMLDVNEAVGFRPAAFSGEWKKEL
jgi:GNAT superfamily N-acetyltransferase